MKVEACGVLMLILLICSSSSVRATRAHKTDQVITVSMEGTPRQPMVGVGCQIDGDGRRYVCVIDSGSTCTVVSDAVMKAEGPLRDVNTANGHIYVHQRDLSLTIDGGLRLKTKAVVESHAMLENVDILIGQDVLRQFHSVTFDYEKQQVEFRR